MRRNFTYYSCILLIMLSVFVNFSFAYAHFNKDTTYLHLKKAKAKSSYLKSGLPFSLPPVKPGTTSYARVNIPRSDDKIISDVEVFPNPTTDLLNFKYSLSRNSNVTIKIMDVLGNEVLTVFQQHVDLGEQKLTYSLGNRLTRGFYFVRINAGTESIIKRIAVL